ncbi:MAG: hypothetical protein J5796_00375 [Erysipelotrichaceae bacterium]|nr:hypothetical protein [Erysipelotrichaceae bacterium]
MMKSDYIVTANKVYYNLAQARSIFAMEAYVIGYARCHILTDGDLDDFTVNGYDVRVLLNGEGYDLYVNGYHVRLTVYDRQIIAFSVSANY